VYNVDIPGSLWFFGDQPFMAKMRVFQTPTDYFVWFAPTEGIGDWISNTLALPEKTMFGCFHAVSTEKSVKSQTG
jgi:hypothetical protein